MTPTELSIIRRHDRPFFIVLRKISLGDDGTMCWVVCVYPCTLSSRSNINSETGLHVFAQSRESPQVPATADENRKRMKRKIRKETTNNGHSRLWKVNTSPSLNKGLVHVKCLFHASWAMCVSCSKRAHNARSLSLHFESTPFPPPPLFLRFFFSSQQVPNFGLQMCFFLLLFFHLFDSLLELYCWPITRTPFVSQTRNVRIPHIRFPRAAYNAPLHHDWRVNSKRQILCSAV